MSELVWVGGGDGQLAVGGPCGGTLRARPPDCVRGVQAARSARERLRRAGPGAKPYAVSTLYVTRLKRLCSHDFSFAMWPHRALSTGVG
eukprot:2601644-Prymnesium_polylepis.1